MTNLEKKFLKLEQDKDTDYLIHFRKITRELERNIEVSK